MPCVGISRRRAFEDPFGGSVGSDFGRPVEAGCTGERARDLAVNAAQGWDEDQVAEFDWKQLKDSVQLNGPTDIALTFVDYFGVGNRDAYRFEQLTAETIKFVEEVERVSGRPVSMLSTSFNWRNVIDRRNW